MSSLGIRLGFLALALLLFAGASVALAEETVPSAKLVIDETQVMAQIGGLWMKNGKGVTLHLKSKGEGLALSLSAGGLKITLN